MCVEIAARTTTEAWREITAYKEIARYSPSGQRWKPKFRQGSFRTGQWVTALHSTYGFNVYASPKGRRRIKVLIKQVEGIGWESGEIVIFARQIKVPRP